MKARNRPYLIDFEGRDVTEDGYGGEVENWTEYCQEYAAVRFGGGSEQREATQTQASQVASFDVLSNTKTRAISVIDHRILFDGGIWNITAKHDLGLNEGIRVTAVRQAA
ncbi:MAG: head-tail adaptor protein [Sphingobium sp.]